VSTNEERAGLPLHVTQHPHTAQIPQKHKVDQCRAARLRGSLQLHEFIFFATVFHFFATVFHFFATPPSFFAILYSPASISTLKQHNTTLMLSDGLCGFRVKNVHTKKINCKKRGVGEKRGGCGEKVENSGEKVKNGGEKK
jgi:hypothetical protein